MLSDNQVSLMHHRRDSTVYIKYLSDNQVTVHVYVSISNNRVKTERRTSDASQERIDCEASGHRMDEYL